MSPASQRAIELVVGFALVGYCAYAIVTGRSHGKFRMYTRSEDSWMFWLIVLIVFCVGVAFVSGHVSWRH
jgi:hypothetical protein